MSTSSTPSSLLKSLTPQELKTSIFSASREVIPPEVLTSTAEIVEAVRREGDSALIRYALQFGDLPHESAPLIYPAEELERAYQQLPPEERSLLKRTADRIRLFAEAQREAFSELEIAIPGGRAGHTLAPLTSAGCYAPGGRFPLPSSVLMTAVTARVAGVKQVTVASPKPLPITLAAAHIAGADQLLAVGGAQAIAALAYGVESVSPVEIIVGPGNLYVTAAKQLVSSRVRIDMLAGPSELVVLADASADPALIASDLIAQAEHDPHARPLLITTDRSLTDRVNDQLARQLIDLPTREIAERSLIEHGLSVTCVDLDEAIEISDLLAPEHLEVMVEEETKVVSKLQHYGALFVGSQSAEVFGDYGLGPNHVLPTGSTARLKGGLSVFDFIRVRTWMKLDPLAQHQEIVREVSALARLEGLEGHARSAEARLRLNSR